MTKNIGWDEKVRVSALRAACASEYESESEFVVVHAHPDTGEIGTSKDCPGEECNREEAKWFPEKDERRTERILARAEVFERWLTRGAPDDREGALDMEEPKRVEFKTYPVRDNPQA